jgi:hypothetical protein
VREPSRADCSLPIVRTCTYCSPTIGQSPNGTILETCKKPSLRSSGQVRREFIAADHGAIRANTSVIRDGEAEGWAKVIIELFTEITRPRGG